MIIGNYYFYAGKRIQYTGNFNGLYEFHYVTEDDYPIMILLCYGQVCNEVHEWRDNISQFPNIYRKHKLKIYKKKKKN